MERRRFSGVMLLFIVLAVVLITQVVGNLGRSGDVSYSDMRAYFTAEKVKSFTATDTRLVAKLQDGSSVRLSACWTLRLQSYAAIPRQT